MATLTLENVVKTFPGGVRAVDGVSLTVDQGELFVLVGPSGCGKTTTLRIVAGLEDADEGTVTIAGRNVRRVPSWQRDVAMVFQRDALYPHLTVAGNLAFGLQMRRLPGGEIRQRVRETAELLGIDDLLDRRPGELSGGQQQRVALGRVIGRRPSLFLFDEPLANLDGPLRDELRREIGRLQARLGTTTVYVTHDQTEAMTLGRRIGVMRGGRIEQVADPQTLYDHPASRFVAATIGSPTMNFFEGRIERRDSEIVFCHTHHAAPGGEFSLTLAQNDAARLAPYAGKPITVGIRPEHVMLPAALSGEGPSIIPAVVETVERIGAEAHVYMRVAASRLAARVDASEAPRPGERIEVTAMSERFLFFDPLTESSLSHARDMRGGRE